MNNTKFIARYLALGAIFTGLSTQASAFQVQCGDVVICDPGQSGPENQIPQSDGTGSVTVPENVQQYFMSVAKFDRNVAAAAENTTPDKIILKQVEVSLTLQAVDFDVQVQNTDTTSGCDYSLVYTIEAKVLDNGLGNGDIISIIDLSIPSTALEAYDGAGGGADFLHQTLADYPAQDIIQETCTGLDGDLSAWIGPGVAQWTLEVVGVNQASGCPQSFQGVSSHVRADVSVKYIYCVEPGTNNPGGCICLTPSPNYRRPGSMLLFPEFDSRPGMYTVLTVTNTDCLDSSTDGGDVEIEFIYVDEEDCTEVINRTETLTPCDTFSVLTRAHTGPQGRGFAYVFAKDTSMITPGNPNGAPIAWNHLTGASMVINAFDSFDYSVNPVAFQSPFADRTNIDLDDDGLRDLDSREYEAAPNIITIPRFFGQDGNVAEGGPFESELILIALSGGTQFETTACFSFWNDNEVMFSGEYTWNCWDKPTLLQISAAFAQDFLVTTDHDLNEIFGASDREAGWICIEGCVANSSQEEIESPAIYATLVEHVGIYGAADLPWECGRRVNGALIPNGVFGDGDNGDAPSNGDNQ